MRTKNDGLTVYMLKNLLEVIDTNRKASLAMWLVTIFDADETELDKLKAQLKKVRPVRV